MKKLNIVIALILLLSMNACGQNRKNKNKEGCCGYDRISGSKIGC